MTEAEAIAELTTRHGWSAETLKLWRRAGFKCEYCGANLLKTSDMYFRGSHRDHIAPLGGDSLDNLALACSMCNYLKGRTDPSENADHELREALTDTLKRRAALVEAARKIIEMRRAKADERLNSARPLLRILGAPV